MKHADLNMRPMSENCPPKLLVLPSNANQLNLGTHADRRSERVGRAELQRHGPHVLVDRDLVHADLPLCGVVRRAGLEQRRVQRVRRLSLISGPRRLN